MRPEQKARQKIDQLLTDAGWEIQDHKNLNFGASFGVAVREFPFQPDAENLPEPSVLAAEIIENLEAALDQFRGMVEKLRSN